MPLRDHFRSPLDDFHSWDGLHGMWPATIVRHLMTHLPEPYFAIPAVHLGSVVEVDVGTFRGTGPQEDVDNGSGAEGVSTRVYAPPKATRTVQPRLPAHDVYEVRIYDRRRSRQVLAVVEILSPSNKDRPENRLSFVAKAAELLRPGVCLTMVDIVSSSYFNLYAELMQFVECSDAALGEEPPALYAVTLRTKLAGRKRWMDCWYHPLELGQPLPTLPIWLKEEWAVPLELEASYEETCQVLRIR